MKCPPRTGGKLWRTALAPATDGPAHPVGSRPPGLRTSPTRSFFCHSHWESANAND
ncbi:hypothetical protein SSCG_01069 [Streptomyces clavuligerus]|nr:hypothetical protein SSCG_01069 [Streptomyces clavuligerus]